MPSPPIDTASPIYDRGWLEAGFRAGRSPKLIFFWGHQSSKDGRITASCLSQWWPASFTVDGQNYPSAEHFMMAEKARLFGDTDAAAKILQAPAPKAAKELGRAVKGFDKAKWTEHRFGIVAKGSYEKFRQNAELRDFLVGTGDKVLVEASPFDGIWGIGLAADDERAENPLLWRGENLLGFALMVARDRLKV